MIGPYPERADLYRARSPVHFADRLERPLLLLQGLDDEVVPPAQAEVMVEVLERKGIPYAYLAVRGRGPRLPQAGEHPRARSRRRSPSSAGVRLRRRRRARAARAHVCALNTGVASAGRRRRRCSTVAATTAPCGTSSRAAPSSSSSPPRNVPAACGLPPARDHPRLVRLARTAPPARLLDDEHSLAVGSTATMPSPPCSATSARAGSARTCATPPRARARARSSECESVVAQIPRPIAAHAATAATAVRRSHGAARGNGTTFSRSAAARRGSALAGAAAAGATRPPARARSRTRRASASSSRQRSHCARCASNCLALAVVEGVERIGGGQVVDVHAVSIPGRRAARAAARAP